jgi:hypothetical protein
VSDDVFDLSCRRPANDAGAAGAAGARGASPEALRFHVSVGAGRIAGCREVRGFHEAAAAARDPGTAPPARLILAGLDPDGEAWLAAWAEDSERVRRTITIRRLLDDLELTAVATLASYGCGVAPALAVESIVAGSACGVPALLRSGVHPKATVEAALGSTAPPLDGDETSWLIHV